MSMLGLDMVELVALSEAEFWDFFEHPELSVSIAFKVYYFLVVLSFVVQLLGIVLVAVGWYRFGGALQIASSALHVPKLEGVVGIIGGVKAWRYPAALAEAEAARAQGQATTT
jgi:hypothetical protein